MTAEALLQALGLPDRATLDQRVPKKLLLDHGAPTAADRRQINEGIEELRWVATLKPTTIGVPAYQDGTREYLEINVLRLTLRENAKVGRIVELVHRAVPYIVVLIASTAAYLSLSGAHKRWSLGEAGKTVLDEDVVEARLDDQLDAGVGEAFLTAVGLARQPRANLKELYQGWLDTLLALQAARRTGEFVMMTSAERTALRRQALIDCSRLETEMASLRAAAEKESQLARQVSLNLELQRLRADHAAALARL
jgi:hypothetical protein